MATALPSAAANGRVGACAVADRYPRVVIRRLEIMRSAVVCGAAAVDMVILRNPRLPRLQIRFSTGNSVYGEPGSRF